MRIGRGAPRRKDANQNEIVAALRQLGCSVLDTSAMGGGFPDLIVGRMVNGVGVNYLMEVKNPATRGKLNKLQQHWHQAWRGQVAVIRSLEDALSIMGLVVDGRV